MSKRSANHLARPVDGLARVPQAAQFLGFSRDTIYRMVTDGEIPHVIVRGSIRIPWTALHLLTGSSLSPELIEAVARRVAELLRTARADV